jgi:acyl-CoA oxidase
LKALSSIVSGKYRSIQEPILYYFRQHPELLNPVEIYKDDHRELAMRQLVAIVKDIGIRPLDLLSQDPAKYFALTEAVGHIDLSLAIKLGVQYRYATPLA